MTSEFAVIDGSKSDAASVASNRGFNSLSSHHLKPAQCHPTVTGTRFCKGCHAVKPLDKFQSRLRIRRGVNPTTPEIDTHCWACRAKQKRAKAKTVHRVQAVARRAVYYALHKGRLIKPDACSECAKPVPKAKLHGHHFNGYENKLDVAWICAQCHTRAHTPDRRAA